MFTMNWVIIYAYIFSHVIQGGGEKGSKDELKEKVQVIDKKRGRSDADAAAVSVLCLL